MEENKEEKVVSTEEIKPENNTGKTEEVKQPKAKTDKKSLGIIIKEFFTKPIDTMESVALDNKKQYLMFSIILICAWSGLALFNAIISSLSIFSSLFRLEIFKIIGTILGWFAAVITPAVAILVLSLIVYLWNRKAKKTFLNTLLTITVAKTPMVIASVVSILNIIPFFSYLSIPFKGFCYIISIILTFFGIKNLMEEKDNNKILITFLIIEAIYFGAVFILQFLGMDLKI